MDCAEHERLERIFTQQRAETSKAAPAPETGEFLRFQLAESQALEKLKEHDAEHGCQGAA